MVKVTWYPQYNQLTIEGHAGAAPAGEDLVCAGVSAIWHTLAANAMAWKELGYLRDLRMQENKGYCQLSYAPLARWKNILTAICGGIVLGLERMAQEYPEHVEFKRLGTG